MSGLGPYEVNTIVVGDCLGVMRQMPSECIDLVLTSPPYANMVRYGPGTPIIGTQEYPAWLWSRLSPLERVCKPKAAVAFNIRDKVERGTTSPYVMHTILGLIKRGWLLWDTWFWIKDAPPTALATLKKRVMNLVEYFFIFCRQEPFFNADAIRRPYAPATLARYRSIHHASVSKHIHKDKMIKPHPVGALPANIWVYPTNKDVPSFPAPMSQELAEDVIRALSKEGDLVLDPFIGSGTTAIAASRLGRDFFGIEINSSYAEIALKRIREDRKKRAQLELF